jgi:SOS-response transcriptional repressor LexA
MKKGRGVYILKIRSFEQACEVKMTEKQKQIFLVIDEWWKRFGFGPSIDDVMRLTNDNGRGNVARTMQCLCDIGVCKRTPRRARSIRPVYLNLRHIK